MKNIIILITLLISTLAFSQKNKRTIYSEDSAIKVIYNENTDKNELVEMIVNDVFVNFSDKNTLSVIDLNKIDSIKVEKSGVKNDAGRVIIKMKPDYKPNFITIKELIDKYLKIDKNPIIFQIDSNIINQDYNKFKVDENYILKIELTKIKTSEQNSLNLVKLITKTEENIKKANTIIMR